MNLLVLNYEYPPLGGGAGEISRNISENIALLGHQVTVVTTWFNGLAEDETINNVHVIRLKSKRKALYRSDVSEMRSWIRKSKAFLGDYCNKNKSDVCFANFALPGGDVAYFLKKRFNIPYAVISHGHDIPWFFKKEMFFYHLLIYFRIKKICKNSSFNFVQTHEMKKNIDRFLSKKLADKNILIPNGIDNAFFYPDVSKRSDRMRLLFCGRLVKQKDPFTFLKALKLLKKEDIDFDAVISGDGPLMNKMKQYVAANNLGENVRFSGWIKREDLLVEYQKANIFVQTSKYEAMSMAVMEALACGSFVICTRVGSNETIIREGYNGSFFKKGHHELLAEKLKTSFTKLIADKNFVSPADTVCEWSSIAEQYLQQFKNILSE